MIKLRHVKQKCRCGESSGEYVDHHIAEVFGSGEIVRIDDNTLRWAIKNMSDNQKIKKINAYVIGPAAETVCRH
jgi:hypothetical protein